MLITTTPSVEGKTIVTYHGLATGQAIMGADLFKDLFASVRNIVGGRSDAYEKELARAKEIALSEMSQEATAMGGNAVIGVDLDYETISMGSSNMLMVAASGTAVTIK